MSETGVRPQTYQPSALLSAAAFALLAALLALPVLGQQTGPLSPFSLRLSSTLTWDANVFRVPDSAPDPQAAIGIPGRSDYYTTTTFGLYFDKAYSQQRFVANVNESAIRYNKFGSLNRDAFNYSAAWLWQLTPRISGTLSTDRQESAVNFEDFTLGRRLVKTVSENQRFTIDGLLFGGWHLLGGASRNELKNGQVFLAIPNSNQTNEEFGLRYIASSGSSITATRRNSRGLYPGQEANLASLLDTGFKVRETEVTATWIASLKSTLNGRLTRTERSFDHFSQLDFSGVGGELRFFWMPTARLSLNVSAQRALLPYFQIASSTTSGSSHRIDDTLAVAPVWQVSEKVSLNMSVSRVVTDYPALGILVAGPSRRDISRRLGFGAAWAVHPMVNLNATLAREERSSNFAGGDYEDTIVGITATVSY